MSEEEMIPATIFCTHHNVEISFIYSLQERGLIETNAQNDEVFIPLSELPNLEKILRLREMDINLEGIETISYLLSKIEKQQQKINALLNQLDAYKSL